MLISISLYVDHIDSLIFNSQIVLSMIAKEVTLFNTLLSKSKNNHRFTQR